MVRTLVRICCLLATAAASTLWGQGGPPGASVAKILSFPSEPGLLFAATNFSGIYSSVDAGQNWVPRSSGLTIANVRALAGIPEQLYAGTAGGGVFRSRDSGLSWEPINQGLSAMIVTSLVSHPVDNDIVYAGTRNGGIFKTTDGGDAWTFVNNGLVTVNGTSWMATTSTWPSIRMSPEICLRRTNELGAASVLGFLFQDNGRWRSVGRLTRPVRFQRHRVAGRFSDDSISARPSVY